MTARPLTEEQARRSLTILIEECGHRVLDPRDGEAFVRAVVKGCMEYRFIGALGFGGKFRNNDNHENTPHVDCYREDESPARRKMIAAANARIAEIFAGERS